MVMGTRARTMRIRACWAMVERVLAAPVVVRWALLANLLPLLPRVVIGAVPLAMQLGEEAEAEVVEALEGDVKARKYRSQWYV